MVGRVSIDDFCCKSWQRIDYGFATVSETTCGVAAVDNCVCGFYSSGSRLVGTLYLLLAQHYSADIIEYLH